MTADTTTIKAFVKLGEFLEGFCKAYKEDSVPQDARGWEANFEQSIVLAGHKNSWFTRKNICHAFSQWAQCLTEEALAAWLLPYAETPAPAKKIAIIMAGNIPLVGLHDLLCVLMTGNNALVKLSSNDAVLIPLLWSFLCEVEPQLDGRVAFTQGTLTDFDAVIATGSDNTARYFDYYFGRYPHIIRRNRNSIAVLTGEEDANELHALGKDIFTYFGLGCRSVSKLFVPESYDFEPFFKGIYAYRDIIQGNKYANNYDYNKAVYLMSEFQLRDNGFLILKEDKAFGSPIASLFYERYSDLKGLRTELGLHTERIQCVVGKHLGMGEIAFGTTQEPGLTQYADGVDTVEFLLTIDDN